ncbi:hypothetical protein ABPG75_005587 [Micractinium tetrahymenae]
MARANDTAVQQALGPPSSTAAAARGLAAQQLEVAEEVDPLQALEALPALSDSPEPSMRQQRTRGPRLLSAAAALPSRLAAQQLDSLAGMSRKVQEAIVHSQRLLERQAAVVEQAVMARAFYAWRHHQAAQQLRRQAALAAARQVSLGCLRRCLHAWCQMSGRHEECALPRAQALLRRSLLARCWREWRRVCGLRWWKLQLGLRDAQLQQLGAQLRHLESRPVLLMQRYRLRALLAGWQREARYQAAKKAAWAAAERHARRAALAAAFGGWQAVAAEKAAGQRALAFSGWRRQAELQVARRELLQQTATARAAQLLSCAFSAWMAAVEGLRSRRQAEEVDRLGEQAQQLAKENARLRQECERLGRVIDSGDWGLQRVQELLQAGRVLQEERDGLARLVAGLQQQQQQVQTQQVQQLPQLLQCHQQQSRQQQRDQPMLGNGHLLHDVINSPPAAGCGLSGWKEERLQQSPAGSALPGSVLGGSLLGPPPARPASPGKGAAARNRLLVHSGSSFNALVRALKQDLVATGGWQRGGPAALLEVDKLSLHRVSLVADDRLAVEAVRGSSGSGSGSNSRSGLLEAALRLQGIGGRTMALSFPRTGGLFTDDFFSPFFGPMGFPDVTREFGRALAPLEGSQQQMALATRGMPVDVVEKEDAFEVKADIPGVKKEDIKVTVDKDVLRINVETSQEQKEEKEEEGRKWHRYERSSQFVGRALRMPEGADMDAIRARYDNGVLVLDGEQRQAGVPKKEAKKEEAKRIAVA